MNAPPEKSVTEKLKRFLTVGLANTVVDFTIFWLCLQAGLTALLGNAIAWFGAVLFSYMLNARWSFDRTRSHRQALPRFMASGAVISLLVSSGFVGLVTPLIGLWPAKIIGTVAAAALNFVAARWSIESKLWR